MMEFLTFWLLSLIAIGITIIRTICFRSCQKRGKGTVSPLTVGTLGIFLATFLYLIPVCYHWSGWLDAKIYIRPVLLALFNTVRVFLLGVDFDFVENALPATPEWFKVLLSLYGMILYVAAPVLTFGNVLAIFKNFTGELRVRHSRSRQIYVISELNPRSVMLAKNIVQADTDELDKRNGEKRRKACSKKPLIVFCDVFTQNEEENYELLLQARELSAICLKKDVSHIDFRSKGESIEIFIIGEDDAENTAQLIELTNKQINSSRTVTIHIFSSDPTSEHILDNLLKTPSISDKLLNSDFEKRLMDIADESFFAHNWQKDYSGLLGNVSVRRINPVDLLTKTILTYNDYADYRKIEEAANITNTISITILGMGHYGTQFLKTAIWFYQRSGICVEFNLFDLGVENGDPQKRLAHECPELIKVNPSTENGDAQYDIRFFTGVDCFSSDFDQKLIEEIARMENTNLVFIALGDDDRNVRAATEMRIAFSRMYASIKKKTPIPFIYTVVNSEEKATYLNESANEGVYPDCRFVSIPKYCYSYKAIEEACSLENAAFKYHLDWVGKENQLRHCYEMAISNDTSSEDFSYCKAFKEELDKEIAEEKKTEARKAKENGREKLIQNENVSEEKMPVAWNNAAFYTDDNGKLDYSGPINLAEVRKEIGRYISESYCRKSSIAKAFHKKSLEVLSEHTSVPFGHSPVCNCDTCKTARITEHMRWNAYMRSIGYQKGPKNKTAKLHHDLKSWHDLPCREKYKD